MRDPESEMQPLAGDRGAPALKGNEGLGAGRSQTPAVVKEGETHALGTSGAPCLPGGQCTWQDKEQQGGLTGPGLPWGQLGVHG